MSNDNNIDPYANREAANYSSPIASREFILSILSQHPRPLTRRQLARLLDIKGETQTEALRRRLRAMERDGQLHRNKKSAYSLPVITPEITGTVFGHPDGFGFLIPEQGGKDLFLSQREMRAVLHGDKAIAKVSHTDHSGRLEGVIIKVIEYANSRILGRIEKAGQHYYLIPNNRRISQDILIPSQYLNQAKVGDIVEVLILTHPTKKRSATAKVDTILGEQTSAGIETTIAIKQFDLPYQWPEAAIKQVEGYGQHIEKQDLEQRIDLRTLPFVTIDGADAKDYDDAVYVEQAGQNDWRLWVAIADVSAYIAPNTPLDKEAQYRGNSVYFPQSVIPMLPESLSNGLCSLLPNTDRLCLVCEMQINGDGIITSSQFHEAIIHSAARLTYDEVMAISHDDTQLNHPLSADIHRLFQLYHIMKHATIHRGAIDFNLPETQLIFNDDKKIAQIIPRTRHDAHRLIETFMIAANVSAADYLIQQQYPTIFRVHDKPEAEKIAQLRQFLAKHSLSLSGGDTPQPLDYAQLLEKSQQRDDAHLLQTLLLRNMQQACYQTENIGHFGLALTAYTHFTSPIRRYPDLLVHRAIKACLHRKGNHLSDDERQQLESIADHCSMTGRRADEASRDVNDYLKCEFMQDKVGLLFQGKISGVTQFGLFIELADIYVEGLIHITDLKQDYYHYDADNYQLRGERSRHIYQLGDTLRVCVARVDLDERKIVLTIAE